MNVSYRWLRELAPGLSDTPTEVARRLAMYGAPVDEITALGEPLRDVVIARVVEAKRHPNADRLSVCRVDAGTGELLNVVCGAPNVTAGKYYPFAPAGSTLPGGLKLERRKIRGEESNGMLCSARELQLGRDHEGILELNGVFTPGESFVQAVALDDWRLLVDVTPNRPDLLSHYGIARELGPEGEARLGLPAFPGASATTDLRLDRVRNDGAIGGVRVRIEDVDGCPRYMAAVVRGVAIGSWPEWLASRLRAIGQRAINNIVDATNYVLHELGQPLHAFDLHRLGGSAIVVRRARAGEKLVTLDGTERALAPEMLAIADAERATAIAGVMGGQESEVDPNTVDVLIECAHFERTQIRNTRRALGMSTDASYRFERGVDPTAMERALRRVVDLILATAGGTAETTLLDVCPGSFDEPTITLRLGRVHQVLGKGFSAQHVRRLLEPIGFAQNAPGDDALEFRIPGHRWFDVTEEIDLVEEVARREGYDNFPTELRPFRPSSVPDHPITLLERDLRERLVARGLLEVRMAGFASEAEGDVELLLPLSSAESRLRRALLPGLLHRVEYNFSRLTRDVRLFELGTAFKAMGAGERPEESARLAVVLTGSRAPLHWSGPAGDYDIWDLKGVVEELSETFALDVSAGAPDREMAGVSSMLEPGTILSLRLDDQLVGVVGQVRADAIDAPAWAGATYAFEVLLDGVPVREHRRYQELPVLPAIEQDLALLVPSSVSSRQVEDLIRAAGGKLLEDVAPFDLYRGKGIPHGFRSIAYRLRFRAHDRTLTDAEVAVAVQRILKRLKDEHEIERRG
jgi:phenylalanyl-tRNA synthetase beta chain